jgi:hypothetical protein
MVKGYGIALHGRRMTLFLSVVHKKFKKSLWWLRGAKVASKVLGRPQRRYDNTPARQRATTARMKDGKGGRRVRGMKVRGIILKTHYAIPLTIIGRTQRGRAGIGGDMTIPLTRRGLQKVSIVIPVNSGGFFSRSFWPRKEPVSFLWQ